MAVYDGIADEDLILRLREGEEQIMDYIISKYKNLVRSLSKRLYILGADYDDLLQEGMIGLFKAVKDYDPGRDASFYTFAELCINRQLYKAVQASNREKHSFLNQYISLYSTSSMTGEEDGFGLLETLEDGRHVNPETVVIDSENLQALEKQINEELSEFEQEVLDLYLTGMPYKEIAAVLKKTDKATENALQRAKGKIKKIVLTK
ncbi:MAG: sigma-70 family RNA polymerase sigma factor [Lachnospiraceae bacterium]|nr:sigma-70 family RNA polymerase sigma factor [Lachnospiraceae bacterium]MBQ5375546.1 sigma-70 family RNA polymerase sigma factor [Lachnospiraceae bacterium]MBR1848524.1 sigma-70 family RNA polymerase sigma factor [Lachnospiraceae bacterium]